MIYFIYFILYILLLLLYAHIFRKNIIKYLYILDTLIYLVNTNKKECNICLDDIPTIMAIKNNCKCIDKYYHINCLTKWSNINNNCPICRTKLNNDIVKMINN